MAEGKNTFNLYTDMIGVFEKLPDEKAGQLIKHIFRYVNDQNPETDDLVLSVAFEPIKTKLKRDLKEWRKICEKNRENINIRWNKKNTSVYERIPLDTKHTDKDKDKDKDISIKRQRRFIKPSLKEVLKYCEERKNLIHPQTFIDHYDAKGWKIGNTPMKDWKAAIRTWEAKRSQAVQHERSGPIV